MNDLDIINQIKNKYQINIWQYDEPIDESSNEYFECDEPNYFLINDKNEIYSLSLMNINYSFDLNFIIDLSNLKSLIFKTIRIENLNKIHLLKNLE
jgi:hypothetical protein